MSVSMATERSLRLTLKLLQFLVSLFLIFSLYNTGPHWILLIACLAVPVYGIYLMVKSPDRTLRQHPVPFVRYKALARNKNWLRVDVAISLTMSVVCFGFSAILFFGYFKVNTATPFYLQAAVASLLLCILYLFNAVLSTRQIEMGTIDFILNNEKQPFSTQTSRTSPLAINTDFSQSEMYFQDGKNAPANYNMPLHKSTVSSLTLLERLQVELAQRKQGDAPVNKYSVADSGQEHYSIRAKTSGLSGATDEEEQHPPATHPKYKYSENSIISSSQTVQSSQGSTVRLDDFDHQMRSSTISISNRMQVNSKSSISDPIPSIASAIDSGRERQKLAAGGTRLREKIQNHKTGSDGIRPDLRH
uniref:Uncharacterized protein n=1 Tax=Ditylenchus dipsaci TaxID=166011 RepID=A0A915E280_9BILA